MTGPARRQIGTVEILRLRSYPLDPENFDDLRTTVLVPPGVYPLYRVGSTTYWIMIGHINQRGFYRLGDGMFASVDHDVPTENEVMFSSRRFGPEEFQALLDGPECQGDSKCLVFTLDGEPL